MTLLAWITALAIRLLAWTWRLRIHGALPSRAPLLLVLWHGDQLALCRTPIGRRLSVLVSRSRDGRFAGRVARFLGLGVISGSTSSGAVAGGLGVVRLLRREGAACLTADGPRGPRHSCGETARRLAELAATQVIPLGVSAARKIRLRSWDRFMIPAPFSKIWVVVGDPVGETSVQTGLRRAARQARELRCRHWTASSIEPRPRALLGLILSLLLVNPAACNYERQQARQSIASEDPTVRARSLRALRGSGEVADAELAARYFKDPSARVRRGAVMAVGSIAPHEHLSELRGLLYDPSLEVRLATIRILGDSGIKGTAEDLFPLLDQRPRVLRRTAAQALRILGYTPVQRAEELARRKQQRHLKELKSGSDQIRSEAARTLGLSGRAAVIPPLQGMLADPSPHVVQQAALALGRILGPRAVAIIVPLSRSSDPQVRATAAAALGLMGAAAVPLLDEIWGGSAAEDVVVKEAVLRALLQVTPWPRNRLSGGALCGALLDPGAGVADQAARLVQAGRLAGCEKSLLVLAGLAEAGDPGALTRLSLIPSVRLGEKILAGVQRRFEAHREQAERWIDADQWRDMGAAQPPDPPAQKPAKAADRAVSGLLARFPPRPPGKRVTDPLLPPAIPQSEVVRGIRGLQGITAARAWLLEVVAAGAPELRVAAFQALTGASLPGANGSGPGDIEPVRAGSGSADNSGAGPQDPLSGVIKSALASKHLPLRRLAARECSRLGADALATGLRLLKEKDPEIQAGGALCLGTLGDPRGVDPLLKLLDQEGHLAALEALCQIADHRASGQILRLLLEDHPPERLGERRFIIEALGRLGDKAAAAALEQELTHPHREVRLAATRALASTARTGSIQALEVCRVDFFADIRRACEETREQLTRSGKGTRPGR